MLLSDLLDQLTYGELSQLELAGVDDEGFSVENLKRIVPHINLGLTELHKRFLIRQEEVTIACEDHIATYVLSSKYAVTNTESSEQYKYIHDSEYEPFQDNVLKIEQIFNEDGQELHLNETDQYVIKTTLGLTSNKAWSIDVKGYNTFQLNYPMEENALVVVYRANHPRILLKDLNPETEEVFIPSYLLEALLQYIAARAYTSLGGDSAQEGNNYMAKFEASCSKVEELGLVNSDNATNQKLEVNGWQ